MRKRFFYKMGGANDSRVKHWKWRKNKKDTKREGEEK